MLSIVISRVNEEIEWLNSVIEYTIFIDKYKNHNKNYIDYIINNYDNLPNVVCFSPCTGSADNLIYLMNKAVTTDETYIPFIEDNNCFAIQGEKIKNRSLNYYKSLMEDDTLCENIKWIDIFQTPESDLDAIYFCSKTPYATYKTLDSFRKYHPLSKVYLISDNGYDYTEMARHFNCDYTHLTENTNTIFGVYSNFSQDERKRRLSNFLNIYIDKFSKSFSKYIILLEDDVLIQNKIYTNKYKGAINGAVINRLPDMLFNYYYRNHNVTPPSNKFFCGHGGSLFNRSQLLECLTSGDMIEKAIESYIACNIMNGVIIHDIFFSMLVILKGYDIVNMDEHMEVDTHKYTKNRNACPILHQVKDYYNIPMPTELAHLVKET
jgi:hypothetical protein